MAIRRSPLIVDRDGVRGRIRELRVHGVHKPMAVIDLPRGRRVEVPFELLEPHGEELGYSISARLTDFPSVDETGASIPIVAERVTVQVRPAPERRVRVRRRVISESRVIETPVWRERVEVERVPVDAFVDRVPPPYRDGDTWIVPCVEEVVVLERRLKVSEELRIRIVRERVVDRQNIVVRRHEVEIEPDSHTTDTKKGDHS